MFICNRCNYTTNDKSNFVKHLKKINICNAIDEEHLSFNPNDQLKTIIKINKNFSCNCGKSYSSSYYLIHHKKTCKIINSTSISDKIQKLEEEVKLLKENQRTPIVINDNRKLIINSFGEHDISYIKNEFFHNLLELPRDAIKNLSQEIYVNDEHPENQNVKITDSNRNIIKIYKSDDDNNGKWIKDNKKKIIIQIIELMKKTFKAFMKENNGLNIWGDGKTYNDDIFEYIFDSLNLNPKFYKDLQKEIELILTNF